jgi:hypothetical protein
MVNFLRKKYKAVLEERGFKPKDFDKFYLSIVTDSVFYVSSGEQCAFGIGF